MNIDESFQMYKGQDYKLGYNIKLDDNELSSQRRVISKIIKFDENNQYGLAMTKPMPVGAIKEKDPSWTEYNILFEKVSLDDKKGHIFIVDIEFDREHAIDRQILYNEIIPPFIEKDTKIEASKRSVYQLLELYSEDKNGNPNKYISYISFGKSSRKYAFKKVYSIIFRRNYICSFKMWLESNKII